MLPRLAELNDPILKLSVVSNAMRDPAVAWCQRPVDATWYYSELLPNPLVGFNPAVGSVYYASVSALSSWLHSSEADPRCFNEKDRLLRELLFGTHDYLHNFAYRSIQRHVPERALATEPITSRNFEDHVFMHLVSEAVATVGLDYWFLCTFDLEEALQVGTGMTALTVSYSKKDEREYRRFFPGFGAQTPSFLRTICEFYCTGEFLGFDLDDIRRSPRLYRWLAHEVSYGDRQRRYTRDWMSYLATEPLPQRASTISRAVECGAAWQCDLMDSVGTDLWDLIFASTNSYWGAPTLRSPSPAISRHPDFRFTSLAGIDLEELAADISAERIARPSAQYAIDQYIAGIRFDSIDPELIELVPLIRQRVDLKLAMSILGRAERVSAPDAADRNLFLLP